jgi:hypothetical protein
VVRADFLNPMVFCQIYLRQFAASPHFATQRWELKQPISGVFPTMLFVAAIASATSVVVARLKIILVGEFDFYRFWHLYC